MYESETSSSAEVTAMKLRTPETYGANGAAGETVSPSHTNWNIRLTILPETTEDTGESLGNRITHSPNKLLHRDITRRIRLYLSGLAQHPHDAVEVLGKVLAESDGDISEYGDDGGLGCTVEDGRCEGGEQGGQQVVAVGCDTLVDRTRNVSRNTDSRGENLEFIQGRKRSLNVTHRVTDVFLKVLFDGDDEGGDGHECVFGDGGVLGGVGEEAEDNGHDTVSDGEDGLFNLSDDCLRKGSAQACLVGIGTHLGNTAAVTLQLVPTVLVIRSDQLVVHVEQVLHSGEDVVADLLGETDRIVGRVGNEDGDGFVCCRSGVSFVVGPSSEGSARFNTIRLGLTSSRSFALTSPTMPGNTDSTHSSAEAIHPTSTRVRNRSQGS